MKYRVITSKNDIYYLAVNIANGPVNYRATAPSNFIIQVLKPAALTSKRELFRDRLLVFSENISTQYFIDL